MDSSGVERNPVEELAEEFVERYRRGERPVVQEYAERCPACAEQIRALFPALLVIERARPHEDAENSDDNDQANAIKIERLGDYRILREIGRGGMGIVYEAEQESLGRHVALKVLARPALLDPRHLRRFHGEARAAARLHHTNIVPVFGVGEQDGLHYYVMQFIPGHGLDGVLVELRQLRQGRVDQAESGHQEAAPVEPIDTFARSVAQSMISGEFQAGRESEAPAFSAEQLKVASSHEVGGLAVSPSSSTIHLPGQPDGSALSESGRRYCESVARIGVQVAEALAYAHAQGVLHRDIKPSNLLLDLQGTVWITDFGLAKAVDSDELTHTGDIVGTLRYMAPERFSGQSDARGDVYGLGLTLYELLTLQPAYQESDRHKLMQRIVQDDPTPSRELNPNIPRDLETIVLKATAREPARRYQTAEDLADELRRFLRDEPIRARRIGQMQRIWRWCQRKPTVASLAAAVSVLVVAGAIMSIFGYWQISLALAAEARERLAAGTAESQARVAESVAKQEAQHNRRLLYDADMQLAAQMWDSDYANAKAVLDLLNAHLPSPDEEDQRDFAWHYQWAQLNYNAVTVSKQKGPLSSIEFDPDGHLVTLDVALNLRRRDLTTRHATMRNFFAKNTSAFALAPNTNSLALAGDDACRLVDTHSGATLWQFRGPCPVVDIQFSCDGRTVASLWRDRKARSWNAATGEELLSIDIEDLANYTEFGRLAVAPDGKAILIANHPGNAAVTAYDIASSRRHSLPGPRSTIGGIAFSPDGRLAAAGDSQGQVFIWDTSSYQPTGKPLVAHAGRVAQLRFSSDSKKLATGGMDAIATVWDTDTRQRLFRLKGHTATITGLVFSQDGTTLASNSEDGATRLWDLSSIESSRVLDVSAGKTGIVDIAYSRDGAWVATCAGTTTVWQAYTGELLRAFDGHFAVCASFSPDGKVIATGGHDGCVKLWDLATGRELRSLQGFSSIPESGHGGATDSTPNPQPFVASVAFSPNGTTIAAGFGSRNYFINDYEQIVKIWDVATGEPISTLTGHENAIPSLAFSPDGRMLGTAGRDRTIRLWNTSSWTEIRTLDLPDRLMAFVFSPHGDQIAAAGDAGTVYVWDAPLWTPRYSLTGHSFGVRGLSYSRDGNTLASASSDRTVKLWDVRTGRETRTLRGHADWVYCVAFSPDGRTLATGSEDQTARLWDTLSPQIRMGLAHSVSVPGLDFDDPQFRSDRAELYVRFNEYIRAAADFVKAIEGQPDKADLWYSLGIAYLAAGDSAKYRATCAEMVSRFGNTTDGELARRVLYTCLPAPDAVPDANRLVEVAQVAAEWRCDRRVLGAALYRVGQYEASIAPFQEAAQDVEPRAWDWLFLAMAHYRLGNSATARDCFMKGIDWQRQHSVPWTERVETESLRKEAEQLLNGGREQHADEAP